MKLLIIIQLCLAFMLASWYLTQPFMGEYFTLRSRMLLYEYVMGTSEILKNRTEQEAIMSRHANHFKTLPTFDQEIVRGDYHQLQAYAKRSAIKKMSDGLIFLLKKTPLFEQAWIIFSVTIAILLLLKREGAIQATWLLPMIVLSYGVDQLLTRQVAKDLPDEALFPTEKVIMEDYLKETFAASFLEQKKQLEKGWRLYLLKNWADPSDQSVEAAEFNFTLARLKLYHTQKLVDWIQPSPKKLKWATLLLYFLWNVFFAFMAQRQLLTQRRIQLITNPNKPTANIPIQ